MIARDNDVRFVNPDSALTSVIELIARYSCVRLVKPDSGLTSLIELSSRRKSVRFVNSDSGLTSLTELPTRINLPRFVAASKPVRLRIPLSLAFSLVNPCMSVSVMAAFDPKPSSVRTAAAKFGSGIVNPWGPLKLLFTSVTSRILTVPSAFTSVRLFTIELPVFPKAAITSATSVASTLPSSLTSHGG